MPDPRRASRVGDIGEMMGAGLPVVNPKRGSNRGGRKLPPRRPGAFLVAAVMLSTAAFGILAFLFLSSSVPEITLPGASETTSATSTGTPVDGAETPAVTPTEASAMTVTATSTPTATAEVRLEVGGTGGRGAYMRAKPSASSQPVTSLEEGTRLTVIGEDVAADGYVWRNVEDPEGNRGWIVANFLIKVSTP